MHGGRDARSARPEGTVVRGHRGGSHLARSFINDHDGAGYRTLLLFAVLGKLSPGAGCHEPSAQDARRRIIAFFDARLKA